MPDSPTPAQQPVLVNVATAARMLGISSALLYRLSQQGRIPSVKINTRRLYSPDSLRRWADSQEAASTTPAAVE